MMSKVNKTTSDDMYILFIDLEVTTEELNTDRVQNVLEGGRQGMACRSVAFTIGSLFCINYFLETI